MIEYTSLSVAPCRVCARGLDRPMVFRNEPFCSDHCRKVISGEIAPTLEELGLMEQSLFDELMEGS